MRGKTGGLLAFFLAVFFTRVFQVEHFLKRFSECRCGMSWMRVVAASQELFMVLVVGHVLEVSSAVSSMLVFFF